MIGELVGFGEGAGEDGFAGILAVDVAGVDCEEEEGEKEWFHRFVNNEKL